MKTVDDKIVTDIENMTRDLVNADASNPMVQIVRVQQIIIRDLLQRVTELERKFSLLEDDGR